MEQQKWYQIDFYVGLYDIDNLCDIYSFKESVDKITDLIGNCTIFPCVGSFILPSHEIRINMNSLKITKFINENPQAFVKEYANILKEIFNQESIISNITNCCELNFNQ